MYVGLETNNLFKIARLFMAPMTLILTGVILVSWGSVVIYSKLFHKDETAIEKKLEEVIEHNVENALNLPEGTLDGRLNFMVQPIEESQEDKKD